MATQLFLRRNPTDHKEPCAWGMTTSPSVTGWTGHTNADSHWRENACAYLSSAGRDVSVLDAGTLIIPSGVSGVNGILVMTCGSDPVTADFTLSGTVTFNIWGRETQIADNAGLVVRLYRYRASDDSLTLVVESARGVELSTSNALNNWTASPTSTQFLKGDRVFAMLGIKDTGGTLTGNGSDAVNIRAYGTTAGVDGDTWIQLNETVSFDATDPSASQLWLSDTASPISGGKKLISSAAGAATTAITSTVAGPTSPIQATKTAGGAAIEWYSDQVAAFTLAGKVIAKVYGACGDAGSSKACFLCELAIVDGDGTNVSVWAKSVAMMDVGSNLVSQINSTWSTTTVGFAWAVLAAPDKSVAAGQRLRFRVYLDDDYGDSDASGAAMLSGHNVTLRYAGAAASDSESVLTLPSSLSPYVPPAPPTVDYRIDGPFIY